MLCRAAEQGAAVRLLVDDHPGPTSFALGVLGHSGVPVTVRTLGGRPGADAHWKVIIRGVGDDVLLAVGTGNLDLRDAQYHGAQPEGTRELWVTVAGHPALAEAARGAVDAAWAAARAVAVGATAAARPEVPPVGDPGTHTRPLLLEVPRSAVSLSVGGAAVGAVLGALIAACRERALICVPYVHLGAATVRALVDQLALASRRGVDTRLLLGAQPGRDRWAATVPALRGLGVEARVMDATRLTTGHTKVAVIDATAVCGSANWSASGLGGNLEAAVAIADVRAADHVAGVIDHDWRASTAG